jgi:hypothetical protein
LIAGFKKGYSEDFQKNKEEYYCYKENFAKKSGAKKEPLV